MNQGESTRKRYLKKASVTPSLLNDQTYSKKKYILENQQVDQTQAQYILKQTLSKFSNSQNSYLIQIILAVYCFISCFLSVLFSYKIGLGFKDSDLFKILEITFLSLCLLEFAIRLYTSQHLVFFLFQFNSIVDVIVFAPIFFIEDVDQNHIEKLISISRIFRCLKFFFTIYKLHISSNQDLSKVQKQIINIIISLGTIAYISSNIILLYEQDETNKKIQESINIFQQTSPDQYKNLDHIPECSNSIKEATFHEYFYFVIVTLSTVGYGDVNTDSEQSKFFVFLLILYVVIVIPRQTNELIRLIDSQSHYARNSYKNNELIPHIVICGQVTFNAIQNMCIEYFHPDHGNQEKRILILDQNIPDSEFDFFLQNSEYEQLLTYLQGSCFKEKDLKRSAIIHSQSCMIITNMQQPQDQQLKSDYQNIMMGLVIKNYIRITQQRNIPICLQVFKPESQIHFQQSIKQDRDVMDQVIVIEEIKMNLLAKSCFSPGVIALVGNLITTAGEQDTDKYQEEWIKEYVQGMGHEIYRTKLSKYFNGKTFSEVAQIIYEKFEGIVFGIEVLIDGKKIIKLNPGPYVIQIIRDKQVFVYMICQDKFQSNQVTFYNLKNDNIDSERNISEKQYLQPVVENEVLVSQDSSDDETIDYQKSKKDEIQINYFTLKDPTPLVNVSPTTLQGNEEVKNHVLVCGMHSNIYYFLLPLRNKYLREYQYIVILNPEKPSPEIWETIHHFPKIIFVKGSALMEEDLRRANIDNASQAVILGQQQNQKYDNNLIDATSIFIYQTIKKCNQNLQIIVDLIQSSNIEFLIQTKDTYQKSFKYDTSTPYSAGEIYISQIIDTLTCQSYYNPFIMEILSQLVSGVQISPVIQKICERENLHHSNLWQIYVPDEYLNKTFSELFIYLCTERNLICLGLYRLATASDNTSPFCYTNPCSDLKLTHKDKVFVLSYNMPIKNGSKYDEIKKSKFDKQKRQKVLNIQVVIFKQRMIERRHSLINKQFMIPIVNKSIPIKVQKTRRITFKTVIYIILVSLNINAQKVITKIHNYINLLEQEVDDLNTKIESFNNDIEEKSNKFLLKELQEMAK